VLEVAPGNGWYTEILAPYLRDRGQLFAADYATDDTSEGRRRYRANFEARLRERPEVFDRVKVVTLPNAQGRLPQGPAPGSVDTVLTFRNLHNWIEEGALDAYLRAFHTVLKPGGTLGVEEHRAPEGTSVEQMAKSGYMTESFVVERAAAAGFKLAARSEANANPRDTKDHVNGVWSLPPTLRGKDVDRERFVAIGESDRMTLRFVKAG
jgi:predicted methyltransferase